MFQCLQNHAFVHLWYTKAKLFVLLYQETMQDETRQKLSLQSKLRAAQDEKERLEERLEEEEETKRAQEKQLLDINQKVQKYLNYTLFSNL